MYRRIPILSAYPVRLSVTTTQQAAADEVHPDNGASAITPIRSEVVSLLTRCEM